LDEARNCTELVDGHNLALRQAQRHVEGRRFDEQRAIEL
jgi:hypothetical protein